MAAKAGRERLASNTGSRHAAAMRTLPLAALFVALPVAAPDPPLAPGRWDVTSTVVDLSIPGVPGFMQRMARGKSKAERKCLAAGQGVAALLAPDPKAPCRTDSLTVGDGRYAQALTCPQRNGAPLRVLRSGTYDASGLVGRASMAGMSPKGAMTMTLSQRATHVAATCPH